MKGKDDSDCSTMNKEHSEGIPSQRWVLISYWIESRHHNRVNESWWSRMSHSGVERGFWNLPQYRLYKLDLLGAGYVVLCHIVLYRTEKGKGFVTLPPS